MAITTTSESQSFGYTGGVQTFTAPFGGLYKLETWGAGDSATGAYAVRHVILNKGDTLYVVCGGKGGYCGIDGSTESGSHSAGGGYNGGGSAKVNANSRWAEATGGCGATHIATTNRGVLSNYASYQSEVLVVAGGAGGYAKRGGTTASAGAGRGYSTSGHAFGQGGSQGWLNANSGGGGGWYGGTAGAASGGDPNYCVSSSGGSSYIGVTANSSTTTYKGVNYSNSIAGGGTGNGSAKITYVAKATIGYFNDQEFTEIVYNGTTITSLVYNGTKIF